MEKCLEGLNLKICLIYIDDLIIFSRTYEEHVERLELVFRRLQECGLKLAPQKCKFFKRKVRYVGYIVSAEGIEADPEKIDKIQHWPTPSTPEDIRKFLGFAGYYRKFVQDFSKIARPLSELMPKCATKKSRSKTSQTAWNWGPAQEEAFQELKNRLSSPPVLGFADFSRPFELHTDARLARAQLKDTSLAVIMEHLENATRPDRTQFQGDPEMTTLLKTFAHLTLREGHPGRDRTLSLLKERFYWPGMTKDVDDYLKICERCLKRKGNTSIRAPLVSIQTLQPMELVCMDFLTLEPSKGGQQLPVDLAFGLDIQPSKPKSLQQYTKSLRDRLQEAYHLASQNSKEAQQDQKTYF
ncbi:uncharacterized protein LOC124262803 [Haliotis rubra]|uniref:uncharacterized protein LOC124262803 n=1 Tax=Haliotis rubra TaxID=36100 RepID=UPI001EE54813|nr:uncharacterized protein LOC124262803 [Haliotis rubra]